VSGHKFQIAQLVNYLSRDGASGVYQVTQLLPPEGEYSTIALRTPTSLTNALPKRANFVARDLMGQSSDMSFDYSAPAELFLAKPMKGSRSKYRRFETAAEALRYAVEDLRTPRAFGAWLQVGDQRFNSVEIQRLYEDGEYPLRKSE
jgi:hypothetical protein